MTKNVFLFSALLSVSSIGLAQTFSGPGGPIFDDGRLSDYSIDVQGLVPEYLTQDNGLVEVCINLVHTWDADLDIRLISPDGTNMMLSASKGDDGDNYENTCFDMRASDHIISASAPFTGLFRPFSSLGNANNGHSGNGHWTLRILDAFPYADSGDLLGWSITFGDSAAIPVKIESSSFPIILLNTYNITIPNEPKVPGKISVIDNPGGANNHVTDAPAFIGFMGIEVRGASSQGFPKKNYGMEIQDSLGNKFETPLIGLPKEEDWILYAPYTDKSFMRDALTYKLGRDEGRYAPRTKFCELFLNGDYQGVYCLEEKIKRDKNRVNISKLTSTDTNGDQLTGGYILKVDRDDGDGSYFLADYDGTDTAGQIRIVYEDPKGPDLQPEQQAYIQGFYHAFEAALYGDNFTDPQIGYRHYIDVPSFIDNFLVSELGHNVDAYRLSTYMYKDRDSKDSLLHLGPLWDFNLAYGNVNYCNSESLEGWAYNDSGGCGNTPTWWPRLLQDTFFQNELRCRYNDLRENVLSTSAINHYIDSLSFAFAPVEGRNYDRWPVLGIYVWPNNFIGQTFQEEVDYMKNWITGRLAWMDENLPGNCTTTGIEESVASSFSVTPNPANHTIQIRLHDGLSTGTITITDITGKPFISNKLISGSGEMDVSSLPSGSYVVFVQMDGGKRNQQKLVILH
ncbi:MAG: CotH kinase family protein [Saprospiraceae bacterium]